MVKHLLFFFLFFLSLCVTTAQTGGEPDCLQAVLKQQLASNDTFNLARTYFEIGKDYSKNANYFQAGQYLNKALNYAPDSLKVKIHNLNGTVNWYLGNYENAMREYRFTHKLSERIGDDKFRAMALNNIGFIYAEYDNYDKTLEYYKKALQVRISLNDKKGIGLSYNSIGRVYLGLDSLPQAFDYFKKALKIFEHLDYSMGISNALNNIACTFYAKDEYDEALKNHFQALEIRKKINHQHLIAESYKNMAKVYFAKKDYKNTELIINKGIQVAKEINSAKLLKTLYFELFNLKNSTGNHREALLNHLKFVELKDSLHNIESEKKIAELEIQYQTEKKEQQIELLSVKDELNKETILKQKSNQKWLIGFVLLLTIAFIIVFVFYWQRNRAYKMLVKQNMEIVKLEENQLPLKNKQKINNEQQIINDLLTIVEEKECFLNPNCTIDDLAKKINTNRQYLSKIINETFNSSFSNFINTYRIKEARKLLMDQENDKYTIDAIAKLAGFNNRATFNAAFKKNTGVSPSFFKKTRRAT